MQVILLADVPKIGRKFDVKDVSDGYAANFLFPRKLAEKATPDRLKRVEEQSKRQAEERRINDELLAGNLASLKNVQVELTAKVNELGHLYQSIHAKEIAQALKDQHRIELDPEFLNLEHPLKEGGEHLIEVEAHGHKGTLKVLVKGEAGEK